jgi:hypothetical protein
VLFFEASDNAVSVIRILNGARDLPEVFGQHRED